MPYDAYLAIWKTKGKVPMVPTSTATHPVSAVGGQVAKAVKPPSVTPQALGKLLENMGIKKGGYTSPQYTHTGQMYGGGSALKPGHMITKSSVGDGYYIKFPGIHGAKVVDAADDLKAAGYDVTMLGGNGIKVSLPKPSPGTETMKYANDLKEEVDGLFDAWKLGKIDEDDLYDAIDMLGEAVSEGIQFPGVPSTYMNKLTSKLLSDVNDVIAKKPAPKTAYAQKVAAKKSAVKKAPASPPPFVVTSAPSAGGLTYDAAQAAYKLMKQQMPGATPATWRHAAAKHLGVDYNDYLKAWKAKPSKVSTSTPKMGAPKTPAPPAASSASGTNVIPLNPSSVGKYANAENISVDDIKDELARLFGPSANKQYINPDYNPANGMYTIDFPTSILTKQGMADVAAGLQKLGLKVEKLYGGNGNKYKIGPAKFKAPPPEAKYKMVDGKNVLNLPEAQKDTNDWWDTLSSAEQASWNKYTGAGYTEINRALRGLDQMTSIIRKHADNLNGSMVKVDESFTAWRGGTYDVGLFKKGGKFHAENFTSTAVNTGGGFGGNVRFEITISKGTKGRFVGKKSRHPGENEFLVESGIDYRVTDVEILSNGNAIVKMTSIPKK